MTDQRTDTDAADDRLPAYVTGQLDFYDTHDVGPRVGYAITEATVIAASAAVPVSVAAGAPEWIPAVLGAVATVATGLRQAFSFRENWMMRAVARESIKVAVAAYENRDANRARQTLIRQVGLISMAETARWQQVIGTAPHREPCTENNEKGAAA